MSWFDWFLNSGDDCLNIQNGFEIRWKRAFLRNPETQRVFCVTTDANGGILSLLSQVSSESLYLSGVALCDIQKEISSLSVEPSKGESLIVTVFEINKSEILSYIVKEHEFRFLAVQPETLEGDKYVTPAVLCTCYSDEEYFQNRCKGSQEIYHERYGRFGIDKIWRDDVLPCRVYCRHCGEKNDATLWEEVLAHVNREAILTGENQQVMHLHLRASHVPRNSAGAMRGIVKDTWLLAIGYIFLGVYC